MQRVRVLLALSVGVFLCAGQLADPVSSDRRWIDSEGLYVLDDRSGKTDLSFVITYDGVSIPPKSNDPDAPTLPGFYVGTTRYRFAAFRVSSRAISFRTARIAGTSYRFTGRVGRAWEEAIGGRVPFVVGTLVVTQGRRVTRVRVRFDHAVVA